MRSTRGFILSKFLHRCILYSAQLLIILVFLTSCSNNDQLIDLPGTSTPPTEVSAQTPKNTPTPTLEPSPTPILNEGRGSRYEESLDGTWEFIRVDSLDDPLLKHGWEPIEVPSLLEGSNYERVWYRRLFSVDSAWKGKRLSLHFGGIKYNSTVYVNGVEVGGCFNGQEPFEVDITDAVVFGIDNEILIGVHDWTGVLSSPIPLSEGLSVNDVYLAENRLLSPIATSSDFLHYGIWDSVFLRVTEPVYIADLFIHSLVSESQLDIDITMTNSTADDTQVTVTARIFPWLGADREVTNQWPLQGDPVLTSEGLDFDIPAGQTKTVQISFNNPPLALWTPFQPNLYVLEISLGASEHDAERVRFGYREITVEGPDFYLNGEKIHLLAVVWYDHKSPNTERIREELLDIRAMNVNTLRTYDEQYKKYYELADEIGLLMISQVQVGNGETIFRLKDPVFWRNYQQYLLSRVDLLKNHPSIIMWGLTAEFYNEILREDQAVINQLAMLAESIRETDTSRPILFSGDGDPGGAADVVGYHYPNEPGVFPGQRYWPAAAYWADKPILTPKDWFYGDSFTFWHSDTFFWDRSKPLFIGEQLCLPGSDGRRLTPFVGDEAYLPYHDQYDPRIWYEQPLFTAKAAAFEMQILASRLQGVSGFTMFGEFKAWSDGKTMLHEGNPEWVVMREMNQPLAAFLTDYDNRFFSGETVSRTIALFNDTMQTQPAVTFNWSLLSGESVLSEGVETFSMPGGDILEHEILFNMPTVDQRTEVILRLQMSLEEEIYFEKDYPLVIFPDPEGWQIPRRGIAIYDPDGTLSTLWRAEEGVIVLENLANWDGDQILILGKNATQELPTESLLELRDKVQQGGRVLAIEQDISIGEVLPVTFTGFGSSLAFLQTPSHPIMDNFEPEDFRWWRGDLLVSYADPVRTGTAGMTHLVASGSMKGMNSAPLFELKQGKGHWILSQLAVISKLDKEPVAPHLLQAMLNYLDNLPAAEGKVLLSDPTGVTQESEMFLEVDWQVHNPDDQTLDLSSTDLLILHKELDGMENHLEEINQYVTNGGVLLLDQPAPDLFSEFANLWNLKIKMLPYKGAAYLISPNEWENAEDLLREDFLWLTETEPFNLMASTMASGAAESLFLPNQNITDWIPLGTLPGGTGRFGEVFGWANAVVFFANDLYEWDLVVPESESNEYNICLQALTRYEGDDPPQVSIWIDEKLAGIVRIQSPEIEEYCIWTQDIQSGTRRLGIEYINRNMDPVEVKDVEIHKIAIQPFENQASMTMISNPTALVSIPIGEGELIINGIQWQQGGWRGQRLFAGLLTSFGASWQPGNSPIVMEGEDMKVQAGHPWYSQITDHAWLINNATLTDEIMIPSDGSYKVVLFGKGLPLHDQYPVFQIYLDGIYQGEIEIDSSHWQFHSIEIPLMKGVYTLSLVLSNNDFDFELAYGREVWIDQVRIYQ